MALCVHAFLQLFMDMLHVCPTAIGVVMSELKENGRGGYFNTILHLFRVHSLLFALGRKSVNGNSVPPEHLDVLENRNSGPRVWLILNKIVSGLDNPNVFA